MRNEINTYELLPVQVKFDFESESKSTNFTELDSPLDTGNESDTISGGSDVYPKNRNENLSFPCVYYQDLTAPFPCVDYI